MRRGGRGTAAGAGTGTGTTRIERGPQLSNL